MLRTGFQIVALCILAAVPAVLCGFFHPLAPPLDVSEVRAPEVELETALAWGERTLWVDARSVAEFEQEHIPGAVALGEDMWNRQLDSFLEAWDYDRMVVVYCSSELCDASSAVAARLKREMEDMEQIYVLKGGWQAWLQRK